MAREVGIEGKLGGQASVPGASGTWRDLTDNVNRLAANLTTQVRAITEVTTAVAKGDLTKTIMVEAAGEVADLKNNVNEMIRNLKETTLKNTEQDWLKTNLAKFTQLLQGQKELLPVSKMILSELAPLVNGQHGAFYLAENGEGATEPVLKLVAGYAYRERKGLSNHFRLGEGLVGQCALEKERILLTDVPPDYIHINSGLGSATPYNIVVLPVVFENQVKAVIELASFKPFNANHLAFLDQLTESIAIVLNTIEANMRTEALLVQSQNLTQELQSQQKELTETNRRLEQQAKSLQASEELLKQQQEELQNTNTELEDKAQLLARQKAEVERKNREIELARRAIEEKAEQLALTSKYKSEFLANMSHELRTPLNSMLILSKMLSENREGNLDEKQIEYAETIHSSGADLLGLINEILDLSKIESGTMSVDVQPTPFQEVADVMERTFRQVANRKGLDFDLFVDPDLPEVMHTDRQRLLQVLKNLLSNAFKFTEEGSVSLRLAPAEQQVRFQNELLNRAHNVVAFTIADTGIGIPAEKQKVIFEAFQQANGATSRNYGGTGLGLSISREIARLLGGEIVLESAPDEGSSFTLYLPLKYQPTALATPEAPEEAAVQQRSGQGENGSPPVGLSVKARALGVKETGQQAASPEQEQNGSMRAERNALAIDPAASDDRNNLQEGDRVLLIIEDDLHFAGELMSMAREKGFKVLAAAHGEAGLEMAQKYIPSAITLDIQLPGMHGLTLLDQLKTDARTRHIPVHIVSIAEHLPRRQRKGALSQLRKPASRDLVTRSLDTIKGFVERKIKTLLVVEDDQNQRTGIVNFIGGDDIETTAVATGSEALVALKTGHYDCAVIDLGLPDMDGFELIEQVRNDLGLMDLPIVVYTGKDLSQEEAGRLNRLAEAVIVKDIASIDALLDETTLFLHREEASLPEEKRNRLEELHTPEAGLADRKILIVDDDIRNIFALTSLLERYDMKVIYAESGKEGIETLTQTPGIDAVLMDIMMPGMDGYETTRAIRKLPQFKALPIIAVTAKAMKGDRERVIEAGASDYITKPVNVEQLISLLRVWIHR